MGECNMRETFYNYAASLTLQDNGGTFGQDGRQVFHSLGYYVGGYCPTRRLEVAHESIATIAAELESFAHALEPGLYLGTWVHEGIVYINASAWVGDCEIALDKARENQELAIWDIANCETISTGVTLSEKELAIWDIANASAIELTPARD